jgi:2-methylisocitrate lyase-like PEP mutase family enzyme
MAPSGLNEKAKRLRELCKPGDPVVLTNVYDGASAQAVISHPSTKAVATASFAVAAVFGVADADLTLKDNLAGIRLVSSVVSKTDFPFTADLQDGYDDIGSTIKQAIEAGVVGANIEDVDNKINKLRSVDDAVSRIKAALAAAAEAGVPDFCVNARTDALVFGGSIEDAIARGKAYLDAGAVTVYVWGGPSGRGVSSDEIKQLVEALGGMINLKMNLRPGFFNVQQIADLGVARISVGPEMWAKAMAGFKNALETVAKRESFL